MTVETDAQAAPRATVLIPSRDLKDHDVVLKYLPDFAVWRGHLNDIPQVNASSTTWGGVRFKLLYALSEYCDKLEPQP